MPSYEIDRRNFLKSVGKGTLFLTTSSAIFIRQSNALKESRIESSLNEYWDENDSNNISLDKYFLNEAIQEIQKRGYYQEIFSEKDLEKLLKVTAEKELSEKSFSTATLASKQIQISENSAKIKGSIHIPLGKIKFAIEFTQEQEKEPTISLLEIAGSNFLVERLLQETNALSIAEEKLTHPYQTIQQYLNERSELKGMLITNVALEFMPNKIKIHIRGSQSQSL